MPLSSVLLFLLLPLCLLFLWSHLQSLLFHVYIFVCMCVYQCSCSGYPEENSSYIGRKRQELPNTLEFLITKANPMGGDGALTWQVGTHLWTLLVTYPVHFLPLCGPWFPKYPMKGEIQKCISVAQHKRVPSSSHVGWGVCYLHVCTSWYQHSLLQSPWESLGAPKTPLWRYRAGFIPGSAFWPACDSGQGTNLSGPSPCPLSGSPWSLPPLGHILM